MFSSFFFLLNPCESPVHSRRIKEGSIGLYRVLNLTKKEKKKENGGKKPVDNALVG